MGSESRVERVAVVIANRVRREGSVSGGVLRKMVAARDREVFAPALALAVDRRWLEFDGRRVTVGAIAAPVLQRATSGWREEFEALQVNRATDA